MIKQSVFGVEPWCLREKALDLDLLAQTESVFALDGQPVYVRLEQVPDPGRGEHVAAVGAGRHDGTAQAGVTDGPYVLHRARVCSHPVLADPPQQDFVFAVGQAPDGLRARRVVRAAFRQFDAPGLQEGACPVGPGLPVHVLLVVPDAVEWHEGLTGPPGTVPQVAVEHFLPRGIVDLRGLGEHAVQVEQAAADAVWEPEHAIKPNEVRASLRPGRPVVTTGKSAPAIRAGATRPGRDR